MNDDSAPMPLDDISAVRQAHRVLEKGHREIKQQVAALAVDLRANTAATTRIEANTADLVETFSALQGGFKVLLWLGKAAVPLAIVWGGVKAWSLGLFK